jgi:hypothetical protein
MRSRSLRPQPFCNKLRINWQDWDVSAVLTSNEVFLYTSCDQTEMKGVCCTADETAHLHRQKKIGFTRIQWWKQKEKKKEQTCYIKYEGKYFSAERLLICRKNKIANEMSLVLIWIIQLYVYNVILAYIDRGR